MGLVYHNEGSVVSSNKRAIVCNQETISDRPQGINPLAHQIRLNLKQCARTKAGEAFGGKGKGVGITVHYASGVAAHSVDTDWQTGLSVSMAVIAP